MPDRCAFRNPLPQLSLLMFAGEMQLISHTQNGIRQGDRHIQLERDTFPYSSREREMIQILVALGQFQNISNCEIGRNLHQDLSRHCRQLCALLRQPVLADAAAQTITNYRLLFQIHQHHDVHFSTSINRLLQNKSGHCLITKCDGFRLFDHTAD